MVELAANRCDTAIGNGHAFTGKLKTVSDTFGTDSLDGNFDINDFFETNGTAVVAFRVDTRPADGLAVDFADHAEPEIAKKFVFGFFHVREKHGEVHDPRHVGIAKFDATRCFESLAHQLSSVVSSEKKPAGCQAPSRL
jgi:hypothetical protein